MIELANAMVDDGHEVTILTRQASSVANDLDRRVDTRVIGSGRSRAWSYVALTWWVRGHIQWILSRDLLHCHLPFGAARMEAREKDRDRHRADIHDAPSQQGRCHAVMADPVLFRANCFTTLRSRLRSAWPEPCG